MTGRKLTDLDPNAPLLIVHGEWNEEDHPRGEDGKFTDGGGGGGGRSTHGGFESFEPTGQTTQTAHAVGDGFYTVEYDDALGDVVQDFVEGNQGLLESAQPGDTLGVLGGLPVKLVSKD